jgi:hypothetical protein
MKTVLILGLIMTFFAVKGDKELAGRWESKPSVNGNVTGVVFKTDNSFEGYVNRKPFVSGTYSFKDTILSFVDNGCEGRQGVYKIIFFSHADSLRFVPVTDSCDERRNGMSQLILGRVKKEK